MMFSGKEPYNGLESKDKIGEFFFIIIIIIIIRSMGIICM